MAQMRERLIDEALPTVTRWLDRGQRAVDDPVLSTRVWVVESSKSGLKPIRLTALSGAFALVTVTLTGFTVSWPPGNEPTTLSDEHFSDIRRATGDDSELIAANGTTQSLFSLLDRIENDMLTRPLAESFEG